MAFDYQRHVRMGNIDLDSDPEFCPQSALYYYHELENWEIEASTFAFEIAIYPSLPPPENRRWVKHYRRHPPTVFSPPDPKRKPARRYTPVKIIEKPEPIRKLPLANIPLEWVGQKGFYAADGRFHRVVWTVARAP